MDFSICDILGSAVQIRQYIEKKTVFCHFKGSQNKVFPVKFWHSKFSFHFPNLQFLPVFQNIMFYHFY